MKLLHTSDWHLGMTDSERSLLEDQRFFIDEICKIIKAEHIDAIMIAGDVYDRSVPSGDAIRLYDYAVTRICKDLHTPVLMIAGNHDSAERLANCSELLAASGLHVCGTIERGLQAVPFDDAEVFLLPWITEEKIKSVYLESRENIQSLTDAYRTVLDNFRQRFTPGKKHILVSHAFITKAETSTSDRAAEIGFATQVPASIFDGFDYVALGHIHKPQDVTDSIRYAGTPMPYSFGKEEKQEKSVTILNTESMELQIIPLPLLHQRTTITGTLEEVLHPTCSEAVQNGYVKACVSDNYVGLEALSELRRVYPNLLEVSGKTYESENASVTMTVQELEALQSNPVEVFRYFCREEIGEEPDEHLVSLFLQSMDVATGEADA